MAIQSMGASIPVPNVQSAQDVQIAAGSKTVQQQEPQTQPGQGSTLSDETVKKQIQNLNELLKARNTNVSLEYDSLSGPAVVKIIDTDSGKVINQMPPATAVDIATKAKDYILGLMIDHKA